MSRTSDRRARRVRKVLFGDIPDRPPRGQIAPFIRSVGIELECELSSDALDRLNQANGDYYSGNPRIEVNDDCSIEARVEDTTAEVTFWSTDLKEIERFLKTMYRDLGVKTNDTCGFHVHIKPIRNPRLFATETYWEGFIRAYRAYALRYGEKYRKRLTCGWCDLPDYDEEAVQAIYKGDGDYFDNHEDKWKFSGRLGINLYSLQDHSFGTVEHRILPAQDNEREAMRSLRWLTRTSSRLLSAAARGERLAAAPLPRRSEASALARRGLAGVKA